MEELVLVKSRKGEHSIARIFNEKNLVFELKNAPLANFIWHTSQNLAQLVNSKHLRFDMRSLDPDKYSYPYHFHRNAEELMVILSGSATLRTPDEFLNITTGDIIFFESGPQGAHQLYNHTEQPCVYLDIRTETGVDVCEYPDSGKINILPYQEIFQNDAKVDYYQGEDKVRQKWDVLKNGNHGF